MQFVTRKRDVVNFSTPQEMYDDYKNRKINGIQDYQSKCWIPIWEMDLINLMLPLSYLLEQAHLADVKAF